MSTCLTYHSFGLYRQHSGDKHVLIPLSDGLILQVNEEAIAKFNPRPIDFVFLTGHFDAGIWKQ